MAELSARREPALAEPEAVQIQRAQRFEPEALAEIYERYFDRIYSFILARVGDPTESEDLTSQVFLKALDALPQYRYQGSSLSAWLHRIAHNLVVDRYRRLGRRPQVELGAEVPDTSRHADPAQSAVDAMYFEQVREALKDLTAEQQEVVTMRFLAGLEPEEIAVATGRRVGAVHALQHRALKSLREGLSRRGLM